MTEEFKGRGMTPHNMPWGGVYPEDEAGRVEMPTSPELDATVKRARGQSPAFVHLDPIAYYAQPANTHDTENLDEKRVEAENAAGVPVKLRTVTTPDAFNIDNIPPENSFEISAKVSVSMDDLNTKMARNGAKSILANELNRAHEQLGLKSYYTPEMLSAMASARLRAQQKAKKKTKRK